MPSFHTLPLLQPGIGFAKTIVGRDLKPHKAEIFDFEGAVVHPIDGPGAQRRHGWGKRGMSANMLLLSEMTK